MALNKLTKGLTLLKNNPIRVVLYRCCSQDSQTPSRFHQSNSDFPSFSLRSKDLIPTLTTRPNINVVSSVIVNGKAIPTEKAEDLVLGATYAIEAVTNILSSTHDLANTELSQFCTPNLFKRLCNKFKVDDRYYNNHQRNQLDIPKEDVFFAWLETINPSKDAMRVVTASFPCYGYIREQKSHFDEKQKAMDEEIKKDIESGKISKPGDLKLRMQEFKEGDFSYGGHVMKNDIVWSNWDFIKVG